MTRTTDATLPRPADSQRLPLPALGLALVSFATLYSTSNGYVGLILLAGALVATYATNQRLPASPLLAWLIRVLIFGTILLTENPEKQLDAGTALFDPGYTNLFGYTCAAELVIRAWVRRAGGPSKGEIILLATLVFAMATNAGDLRAVWWVRTLAPVYLILLVMTLRRFQDRPRGWGFGWVAALGLALLIGGGSSWAVAEFEGRITRWSMRLLAGRRPASTIGLSRTATLGRVFNPNPSPKRVLQIQGWPGEHHVRASAFDQYSEGTWGPAVDQRDFRPVRTLDDPKPASRDATFTRYDDAYGLLCVPLEAVDLRLADDADLGLQQDPSGAIRTAGERLPATFEYALTLAREGTQGIPAKPLTEEERRWNLFVPKEVDPAVRQLTATIATGDDPRVKLARIHTYLRSNHRYSLEMDPGEGDPVSNFLTQKLDGHCVYFASAAVIMARCAGIPARYVSGYFAHETAGGNLTIVRQRDAHAWAECWVDGTGWVTLDATPSAGRPDQLFPEVPKWRRWWERAQDAVAAVRAWLGRRTLVEGAVMIAALAAVPVFIRVWKGRQSRQRRRVEEGYGPLAQELAELGRRFERTMKRRGVAIAPNRPWIDSVAGLPKAEEFVRQYNAVRFGGEGSVKRLTTLVDELEV